MCVRFFPCDLDGSFFVIFRLIGPIGWQTKLFVAPVTRCVFALCVFLLEERPYYAGSRLLRKKSQNVN